jgi:hypothetical protein
MKTLPVITSPSVIAKPSVIARGKAPKQSPRCFAPRDDAGFGLLELMLAAMIAAGITLGYLYNQSRESAINQAQSQAGYYQMVSDAVAKYMAINYDQLKAITKPHTCANPQLFTEATANTAPTGCGIKALFLSGSASSPVANGLQPTLTDLKTTGYLDANFSNSFLWPTQLTMYAASGIKTGSSHAAPEYRVQIQAWCNGAAPSTDKVCEKPVLHGLVYNAQPFAANTTNSFVNFTRLDKLLQARTELGANAFISYDWALKKDASLYSDGNKNQLPNLLKFTSGSDLGMGVEGVLALQATYVPVQTSPTATTIVRKVPFSACNIATDANIVALASSGVARVVKGSTKFHLMNDRCGNVNVFVPAFKNQPLRCVANLSTAVLPANLQNHSGCTPSNVPTPWTQCETNPNGGSNIGSHCWQPEVETFALYSVSGQPTGWELDQFFFFVTPVINSGLRCKQSVWYQHPTPIRTIELNQNTPQSSFCNWLRLD